ncbi:MAG TPA: hypothetical protein VGQ36_02650 [Thermoanaerobaculia bacterium]|jgi:hypothetical protein|nr:hypothetical protein [Thermoanaerobaculia bacterium]
MSRALLSSPLAPTLFAQLSPKPADAIVPVVGSTRGQANANFKTELQMNNPSDVVMAGWLYLRPHGAVQRYELQPHTTISFADIVAEMGESGLGSLEILVERGRIPSIVARAYDDQTTGTTGATIPVVAADAILARNDFAALIAPRDLARYRFNAGVRALGNGATLELIVRAANGTERSRRTVEYAAHHFEQQPGNAFAGIALNADDAIEVVIRAGSAIIYGSTVDNATNDSSVQILTKP